MKSIIYLILPFILCCINRNEDASQSNIEFEHTTIALCGGIAEISNTIEKLPPPQFQEGVGNSYFEISTNGKDVSEWFNLGINYLHDFSHLEAYRVFNHILKLDPNCSMAYWGIAMCQPGFGGESNDKWKDAILKAESLAQHTSQLEKDLIAATKVLVNEGAMNASKLFQELIIKYPSNPEIIAFSSIVIRQQIQTQEESDKLKQILENALAKFPNHTGLMHYYLHLMELREDFALAKPYFKNLANTAPNASHILHMPGHIYFIEGEYKKAIEVFEKAKSIDINYHKNESIPFSANQNYMHNLHFLALTYSELNQKEKALENAQAFANITLKNNATTDGASLMVLYEGRILPALVHIRFGEYIAAEEKISFCINSLDQPLVNPLVKSYLEAMRAYCKGMNAIKASNTNEAIVHLEKMGNSIKQFEQMGVAKSNSKEFKNINETFDILSMAQLELIGWISNIDPKVAFDNGAWDEALDLEKAIKYDEPPRLMYPIGESLGLLRKYRGEKNEAIEAFKIALEKRPKSMVINNKMKV